MGISSLGKEYKDGEVIVYEGEEGKCMYVIQEGQVEVVSSKMGKEVRFTTLKKGDYFGELALFEKEVRSATVRALGSARALTIDKKTLFRRIQEDPSLAFRMLKAMSNRIRDLSTQVTQIKADVKEK